MIFFDTKTFVLLIKGKTWRGPKPTPIFSPCTSETVQYSHSFNHLWTLPLLQNRIRIVDQICEGSFERKLFQTAKSEFLLLQRCSGSWTARSLRFRLPSVLSVWRAGRHSAAAVPFHEGFRIITSQSFPFTFCRQEGYRLKTKEIPFLMRTLGF